MGIHTRRGIKGNRQLIHTKQNKCSSDYSIFSDLNLHVLYIDINGLGMEHKSDLYTRSRLLIAYRPDKADMLM